MNVHGYLLETCWPTNSRGAVIYNRNLETFPFIFSPNIAADKLVNIVSIIFHKLVKTIQAATAKAACCV